MQRTLAQILRLVWRPLFIVAGWLTAVGIATGCFAVSGPDHVIAFAVACAVSVLFACAIPLMMGGKRGWAVEAVLVVACAMLAVGGVTYLFLWAVPSLARSHMGFWEFRRLQHDVVHFGSMSLRISVPLGVMVGGSIGAIAGLLVMLRRQRPTLAAALMAGLLLACVSGPVQRFAFSRATDLVVQWRLDGGNWAVASISPPELASALGATIGGVLGAVIAVGVMSVGRESVPSVVGGTSQASETPSPPC